MRCCTECFCDIQIQAIITAENRVGDCDYCGSKNVFTYSLDTPSDLSDLISDVLNTYEDSDDGEKLFPTVINHWGIFRKDILSSYKLLSDFSSVIYGDDGESHNRKVKIPRPYEEQFGIFSGHTWQEFARFIKEQNRFCNGFFKADQFASFLSYSIKRFPRGSEFYRARICDNSHGYEKEQMYSPPAGKRRAGRVNPEGIGVLYLTSDEETALSEVRASAFDMITVGKFKSLREIRVVDLSSLDSISPAVFSGGLESLAANSKIFSDIARDVAKPLRRNDSPLEYLPTQFITEFIKSKGYTGVAYQSAMGTGGSNIAVFDEKLFECVDVHSVEIKKIKYSFEEAD